MLLDVHQCQVPSFRLKVLYILVESTAPCSLLDWKLSRLEAEVFQGSIPRDQSCSGVNTQEPKADQKPYRGLYPRTGKR